MRRSVSLTSHICADPNFISRTFIFRPSSATASSSLRLENLARRRLGDRSTRALHPHILPSGDRGWNRSSKTSSPAGQGPRLALRTAAATSNVNVAIEAGLVDADLEVATEVARSPWRGITICRRPGARRSPRPERTIPLQSQRSGSA
ncbi:hypothetical protein [Brachybacterium sacelli]|uniref:hypothetical protein n=1 Tax=Brachybacterium sacelli TaxID=173364 RepID=UPI00361C2308